MNSKPDHNKLSDVLPGTPYKIYRGYDVEKIKKQPHLFNQEQLDIIRELIPDFPDKAYDDYTIDEICDMTDLVEDEVPPCLNDDYSGPRPEKAERLGILYSILDMLGEM